MFSSATGLSLPEVGAYAIQRGFSYAVCDAQKQDGLIASPSVYTTNYS